MKHILILAVITIAITSCKPKQTATVTSSSTEQKVTDLKQELPSIIINELVDMKITGDPYTIENAMISGDTLILQLQYGGGCEDHEFELLNNFAFKEHMGDFGNVESYQTRITLKHNANNDRCRSIEQSEKRFDLTKIRQVGVNQIKMNLSGWENELIYKYTTQKH